MYNFRLYYSVRGRNKRRSTTIRLDALCLFDAWKKALDCAIVYTHEDEVLNSIQIIREAATNDN